MAVVNVTFTTNLTCSYWITPEANQDITGLGVTAPSIVQGYVPDWDTPQTVTLALDNGYMWDVRVDFQNSLPVRWLGFNPGSGGDLFTLLAAQGWTSGSNNTPN